MMATKIAVVLEDDLDCGPADETVRFGIGGADVVGPARTISRSIRFAVGREGMLGR
jgi:hypothetical protein